MNEHFYYSAYRRENYMMQMVYVEYDMYYVLMFIHAMQVHSKPVEIYHVPTVTEMDCMREYSILADA